jgi:hypothetical protein
VSSVWQCYLGHDGSRPVGKIKTQASSAVSSGGDVYEFRNVLNRWETHLKKKPEASTPFVAKMLGVSRLRVFPSIPTTDARSFSSMSARPRLADKLLEVMNPALNQPWASP